MFPQKVIILWKQLYFMDSSLIPAQTDVFPVCMSSRTPNWASIVIELLKIKKTFYLFSSLEVPVKHRCWSVLLCQSFLVSYHHNKTWKSRVLFHFYYIWEKSPPGLRWIFPWEGRTSATFTCCPPPNRQTIA